MVILDFGSGGTCRNDRRIINEMIEGLAEVDPDRKCVIKWQLWDRRTEPQCVRLRWDVFDSACKIAEDWGFRTTASVFDKPSLDYLLDDHDVPFVKLANRPYLRHLARYIPRGIPIVYSLRPEEDYWELSEAEGDRHMVCVSKYPASEEDYKGSSMLPQGTSDHTIGLDLWHKYKPMVWEKHYRLPDQRGPDCGPWCITPQELVEVLT